MNCIIRTIPACLLLIPLLTIAQTLPTMPPAGYDKGGKNPGGQQKDVMYQSSVSNSQRKMVVYTPPGYTTSKKYPVLYGVHGIDAWPSTILDDWCCGGRFVSDNLIAEGKIEPVIIVAIDNNNIDSKREILEVVIPYVEKNYPVIADADHRAIYGYSWGGGVAFNVGLGNLNTFHHIGPSSAAPNKSSDAALFPNGGSEAKQKLKTLFISCGTADWMGLFPKSEDAHKYCVSNNIPHQWLAVQGGNHDGGTWRPAMWNFLQLAFPANSQTTTFDKISANPIKNLERTWTISDLFSGSTLIYFSLQQQENVSVSIFDLDGKLTKVVSNKFHPVGVNCIVWNGTNNYNHRVKAGSYVMRIKTTTESHKGTIIQVK